MSFSSFVFYPRSYSTRTTDTNHDKMYLKLILSLQKDVLEGTGKLVADYVESVNKAPDTLTKEKLVDLTSLYLMAEQKDRAAIMKDLMTVRGLAEAVKLEKNKSAASQNPVASIRRSKL